jgi:hypothetical protein
MRTAGLSVSVVLFGLHALSVQAQTACNTDHTFTWSISDLSKLQDALKGPIVHLCARGIETEGDKVITYETRTLSFQISRTIAQSLEECKTSFATIIDQCIESMSVDGGMFEGKGGVVYEIFNRSFEDDGTNEFRFEKRSTGDLEIEEEDGGFGDLMESLAYGSLDARAPKIKAKKPTTKKPATKKPEVKKPTPTPKPATKTKSQQVKASKTSSSIKAGPTKTCDQLYALAVASREKSALIDQKRGVEAKSRGFVGSRIHIEKRASSKTTLACDVDLKALGYPTARQMVCVPSIFDLYHLLYPSTSSTCVYKVPSLTAW